MGPCNAGMLKRVLNKEAWKTAVGGSKKPRRLKLQPDKNGTYFCPVSTCDSDGFKSKRGCRKHVCNRHGWYYFYDEKPNIVDIFPEICVSKDGYTLPPKASTSAMPAFSKECKVAIDFKSWLCSPGGSSKSHTQADQIVTKLLKFTKFCCDDMPCSAEVKIKVVDFCVNSVTMIEEFMDYLTKHWRVGNAGKISYLNSFCHYMDYQRSKGNITEKLSQFMAAEVFITRAKRSYNKNMRLEWNTNLAIETFEKLNCWATLAELQNVIPYHRTRFEQIVLIATSQDPKLSSHDISFCTSFIVCVLFLMVKGSRPMTYQYLTVDMINSAKKTGCIDQTVFKTNDTYGFDSLIFSNEVMKYLDIYMTHIRNLLKPKCNFLLINRNGVQLSKLSDVLGRLVYEAIGKYIHPTRYRQIIETESAKNLTLDEQETISRDQKHTSNVAKVHYQKLQSRKIAEDARLSINKLINMTSSKNEENESISGQNQTSSSKKIENIDTDFVVTDKKIQKNERQRSKKIPFSKIEDNYIVEGMKKYGPGKWTNILNDSAYKFHPTRKACTLCLRAKNKGFI